MMSSFINFNYVIIYVINFVIDVWYSYINLDYLEQLNLWLQLPEHIREQSKVLKLTDYQLIVLLFYQSKFSCTFCFLFIANYCTTFCFAIGLSVLSFFWACRFLVALFLFSCILKVLYLIFKCLIEWIKQLFNQKVTRGSPGHFFFQLLGFLFFIGIIINPAPVLAVGEAAHFWAKASLSCFRAAWLIYPEITGAPRALRELPEKTVDQLLDTIMVIENIGLDLETFFSQPGADLGYTVNEIFPQIGRGVKVSSEGVLVRQTFGNAYPLSTLLELSESCQMCGDSWVNKIQVRLTPRLKNLIELSPTKTNQDFANTLREEVKIFSSNLHTSLEKEQLNIQDYYETERRSISKVRDWKRVVKKLESVRRHGGVPSSSDLNLMYTAWHTLNQETMVQEWYNSSMWEHRLNHELTPRSHIRRNLDSIKYARHFHVDRWVRSPFHTETLSLLERSQVTLSNVQQKNVEVPFSEQDILNYRAVNSSAFKMLIFGGLICGGLAILEASKTS